MYEILINEVAKPLFRRAGTAIGTLLAVQGYTGGDVETIVAAVPLILGILLDLATSHLNRKGR